MFQMLVICNYFFCEIFHFPVPFIDKSLCLFLLIFGTFYVLNSSPFLSYFLIYFPFTFIYTLCKIQIFKKCLKKALHPFLFLFIAFRLYKTIMQVLLHFISCLLYSLLVGANSRSQSLHIVSNPNNSWVFTE